MSKLVTIYGGSGFVGSQVAWALARRGWRVRVAVRRPNQALHVRMFGSVGQLEAVPCNIRDDASVRAAMEGADAVVNCVGIMVRQAGNRFDAVHVEGAARIARLAAQAGVAQLVHLSALGANPDSDSHYFASKAEGEAAIAAAFPAAVILRPSIIFGKEDSFFNKFAGMASLTLIAPVVGARTPVQPVYVGDVAEAAARAAEGAVPAGIYELGGPDRMTFREVMQMVTDTIGRRRAIIGLPRWIAGIMAWCLDAVQVVSGGLITNRVLTRDQVRMLAVPNVVSEGARGFEAFGIQPVSARDLIGDYLWRYRESGQYAAINQAARQLDQRG